MTGSLFTISSRRPGVSVPIPTRPSLVLTKRAGVVDVPTRKLPQTSNFVLKFAVLLPTTTSPLSSIRK